MVKPKTKLVSTPPKKTKPSKTKSAPTIGSQKPIPPPKPQTRSTDGEKKRKKGKPVRKYATITAEE